ncbi:MAG: hypothetical protein IJ385_00420 [Ruminiclostridium sp.]|nr:hypothetical protein [Ruminiclostridium sp.]
MTVNFAIEQALKLHPDTIPDSIKCRWLSELDGKIMRETMHQDGFAPYRFPEDGERQLVVGAPYDNLYELYIIAMSDFFSGEMANYSASAVLFEQAYSEFRKNYIRSNMPPQGRLIIQG